MTVSANNNLASFNFGYYRIETEENLRQELESLKECVPREIITRADLDKVLRRALAISLIHNS